MPYQARRNRITGLTLLGLVALAVIALAVSAGGALFWRLVFGAC